MIVLWGISSRLAVAIVLVAVCAGASLADESKTDACLKAETYPDGSDAWRLCDEALKLEKLDPKVRARINLQLGEAIYYAHRPGMALPYLDKALEADSSLDQAWRRRGWSYLMNGDAEKALSDFTTWLALKPDDPDALFAISFLHVSTGENCAQAAKEFEAILATHPDHYLTRFNLAGQYHCADGTRDRQIAEYDKVIAAGRERTADVAYFGRMGRDDFDFYAMIRDLRAEAYLYSERAAEAAADVEWLTANYPRHIKTLVRRSNLRLLQNDYAGALTDAEAALAMSKFHPMAIESKVEALGRLRRYDDLAAFASSLLDGGFRLPNAQWLHFWRGVSRKNIGQGIEAIADFNQAMAMDEHYIWSVYTQIQQSGYVFGRMAQYGSDPAPDFLSKPFANALEACMVDPECMK